jgi:diaminohydroxyphosphoribosylaminopyrimidine deaminase/5-amino-6-(5-phosphoribosylamino)uracil reductase
MSQPADFAWSVVRAAAREAESAASGRISSLPNGTDPVVCWTDSSGWQCLLPFEDPRRPLIDLYLPFCSASALRPMTLGHLGESLDGFIATHAGQSQWVTGPENVLHMHRLRALCDAVVVGPGTVAADDPQLTTRLVEGTNPLRVVIDPGRRLSGQHRVFTDDSAETLYVCSRDRVGAGETRMGQAAVVGLTGDADTVDLRELIAELRRRGCARVFVEGGGVTVSAFLHAGLLDRLHLAIAPLLIGDGRAAIRFPAAPALDDCHRPDYRVFRMGGDVLFDCDLRARRADAGGRPDQNGAISRVI